MIDDLTTIVATRSFISGPSKTLATTLRKAGHQVSTYEITWRPRGSPYGATHCVELPLLFGDYADWEGAPILGTAPPNKSSDSAEKRERCGDLRQIGSASSRNRMVETIQLAGDECAVAQFGVRWLLWALGSKR